MRGFEALSLAILCLSSGCSAYYLYPSTGNLGSMSTTCLNDLNNIFNNRYLLSSTAASQDTRNDALFLTPAIRLGCRLSLLEALEMAVNTSCPPEDQLINCFWISGQDWIGFSKKCPLFESQVPLPACSDSSGEAAEGVPSCSALSDSTSVTSGRRRLLQGGPVNNYGIATWQYSYGEAAGLQYDAWAPAGSQAAQPPISSAAAGATGADAAALRMAAEGNEGAAISAGGATAASAVGCFPGIWNSEDFAEYLKGNYAQPARPKDIGGINVVGLVSILIYTLMLCSLGAV